MWKTKNQETSVQILFLPLLIPLLWGLSNLHLNISVFSNIKIQEQKISTLNVSISSLHQPQAMAILQDGQVEEQNQGQIKVRCRTIVLLMTGWRRGEFIFCTQLYFPKMVASLCHRFFFPHSTKYLPSSSFSTKQHRNYIFSQ